MGEFLILVNMSFLIFLEAQQDRNREPKNQNRGRDLEITLELTLEEAAYGAKKKFFLKLMLFANIVMVKAMNQT